MAHLVATEPIFLCSWSHEGHSAQSEVGTFLCNKADLENFLLATNVPKLVALQVLTPTARCSWSLRQALTVAHRFSEGEDTAELAFGDDLELFDSWSLRLPASVTLVPLWTAPNTGL